MLVLRGRDVVQGGRPHEQGTGSGAILTESVAAGLSTHGWPIIRPTDPRFDNASIADKNMAIAGHVPLIGSHADLVVRSLSER